MYSFAQFYLLRTKKNRLYYFAKVLVSCKALFGSISKIFLNIFLCHKNEFIGLISGFEKKIFLLILSRFYTVELNRQAKYA